MSCSPFAARIPSHSTTRMFHIIKNGARGLNIRRAHYRRSQLNGADSIELPALNSPTAGFAKDTQYQSHYASDDDLVRTNTPSTLFSKPKRWRSGWRFGTVNCAASASVVFLINLVVTIWGSTHNKSNDSVLYEGDCDRVDRLNTGLHLLINLLSTLLLSSSNYCMQCLSAPTRKEVNQAHAKRMWLDIGVPSIHNLRRISKTRALLWFLLGISSLPLHLLYVEIFVCLTVVVLIHTSYNSAVFSSISVNDYLAMSVSQSFVDDTDCFNCTEFELPEIREPIQMMHKKARKNELEKLNNLECIEQYARMLQSKRRNVLLVASDDKLPPVNGSRNFGTHVHGIMMVSATEASSPASAGDAFRKSIQAISTELTFPLGIATEHIAKIVCRQVGYVLNGCSASVAPEKPA
jgi:hypothetical protein